MPSTSYAGKRRVPNELQNFTEQDEKIKLGDCSFGGKKINILGIHWKEPFKFKAERSLLKAHSVLWLSCPLYPWGRDRAWHRVWMGTWQCHLGDWQVLLPRMNPDWTHRSSGDKWPQRPLTSLTRKSVFPKMCSFSPPQLCVLVTFLMLNLMLHLVKNCADHFLSVLYIKCQRVSRRPRDSG